MRQRISVYAGHLPPAVSRDYEFDRVYTTEIKIKSKLLSLRDRIECGKEEFEFKKLRAEALQKARAEFSSPDFIGVSDIIADLRIASEIQGMHMEDRPQLGMDEFPMLTAQIEAIGYVKRK